MKSLMASAASLLTLSACGGSVIEVPNGTGSASNGGTSPISAGGESSGLAAGTGGNAALQTAGASGVAGGSNGGFSGNGSAGNGSAGNEDGGSAGIGGREPGCVTPCRHRVDTTHCAADQIYWACVTGPAPPDWQASCTLLNSSVLTMCCPVSFEPACQ